MLSTDKRKLHRFNAQKYQALQEYRNEPSGAQTLLRTSGVTSAVYSDRG